MIYAPDAPDADPVLSAKTQALVEYLARRFYGACQMKNGSAQSWGFVVKGMPDHVARWKDETAVWDLVPALPCLQHWRPEIMRAIKSVEGPGRPVILSHHALAAERFRRRFPTAIVVTTVDAFLIEPGHKLNRGLGFEVRLSLESRGQTGPRRSNETLFAFSRTVPLATFTHQIGEDIGAEAAQLYRGRGT
jgi:hypothetical protein